MNESEQIETLYKEIERKDNLIAKLKEENSIIIKAALKSEERVKELEERLMKK